MYQTSKSTLFVHLITKRIQKTIKRITRGHSIISSHHDTKKPVTPIEKIFPNLFSSQFSNPLATLIDGIDMAVIAVGDDDATVVVQVVETKFQHDPWNP